MVANKGSKRKCSAAEAANERCTELAQAITEAAKAANISSDVIQMLADILPHSLGQPKDKRHRFQEQTIEAVNSIMLNIEAKLKGDIESARNSKTKALEAQAPREKDVENTEVKLQDDSARFASETKELARATLDFRAARTGVDEAKRLQEVGDQDYKDATQKKEKLQAILADFVEPLRAGLVAEADVESRCKALQAKLKPLGGFDEAMLVVLGSSLNKPPSARGGFDHMAIEQLDKEMAKHIDPLDKILLAGEEGKQQRANTVQQAQQRLEEALKFQRLRADAFEAAWTAQKDDERALELARQALKDLAKETKASDKSLNQAEADFEVFEEFARKPFDDIRERVTPEPVPEAMEVEATEGTINNEESTKLVPEPVLSEAVAAA